MSSASLAVQTAFFARLSAVLAPVQVYDATPPDAKYPFVTLGDDVVTDWSAVARPGAEIDATIHVWSRAEGHAEAKTIMGQIERALHGKRLPIEGHALTDIRLTFQQAFTEPDGKTRHGVMRFTVRLRRA